MIINNKSCISNNTKKASNITQLKKIKLAKIKYLETEINLLIKQGSDKKIIYSKQKEIQKLRFYFFNYH